MPFCAYSGEAAMFDATPIENMFLIEYMPDAPDRFVCVYLYLRMICIHPELCESFEAMVAALHMEAHEVEDALAYWEREGLIMRVSDNPKRYEILPMRMARSAEVRENIEFYNYRDFHAELQNLFGADALKHAQLAMASEWTDEMHISREAALYLIRYEQAQKGGKKPEAVFRRANKRALDWAAHGIASLEDAKKYTEGGSRIHRVCEELLRRFGLKRAPSMDELNCARRWIESWNLTDEDIFEACTRTINASHPSFGYLDRVLESRVNGSDAEREALRGILRELGAEPSPTPDMQRRYESWRARGFESGALRCLAAECARNRYTSFDRLEKQLERCEALGLHTEAEVREALERMARGLETLLSKAGINGLADIRLFEIACEWRKLGSPEMIEAACARGRTLKEINDLLNLWKQQGLDAPPAAVTPTHTAAGNGFNYDQRTYTREEYERGLFSDPLADDTPEDDKR